MSSKLIQILIIFLNLKIPIIFGENHDNITLPSPPPLPFNFTPELRVSGAYRDRYHTLAKYIVSIRKSSEHKKIFGYTHFCAGSIIEADLILTAAHCVSDGYEVLNPYDIKVVAKTHMRLERTSDTEEVNVKRIISHTKFSGTLFFNDIALLILVKGIKLDGILAAKIPLPQENINPDKLCTVIGWGQMYAFGPLANNMLYSDVHLLSRSQCRKRLPKIVGKKICASNVYDKEADACMGDSGGPLICTKEDDEITGIVSYGYGCGEGKPGVYTNVFRYLDWIEAGKGSRLKPLPNMLYLSVIVCCLCRLQ